MKPASNFETAASPNYQFAILAYSDLKEAAELLDAVHGDLPAENRHFLKPQDYDSLRQHHMKGFPVLGAIDTHSGRLASILLITPTRHPELCRNIAGYPHQFLNSDAAVIQSVATHPDYKRQGLMPQMLQAAEEAGRQMGLSELLAKVADSNLASTTRFEKAGFQPAAEGHDPKAGYKVTYWHKKIGEQLALKPQAGFNTHHASDAAATANNANTPAYSF